MRYMEYRSQYHKSIPTPEDICNEYVDLVGMVHRCIIEDINLLKNYNDEYYKSSYAKLFKNIDFLKENLVNTMGVKPFESMCKMYNLLYDDLYESVIGDKKYDNPYEFFSCRIGLYSMILDSVKDMFGLEI